MQQTVYAFIDSQNLNLGVQNDALDRKGNYHKGWKLDFAKFRRFLSDKYDVEVAFLFIGYRADNDKLYSYLNDSGFTLVFKPTTSFTNTHGQTIVKGNVDADLVLHTAARQIANYDKAVVVSGDGDFLCLYDFLDENSKLLKIVIPNKLQYSSLLTKYREYLDFVSSHRKNLEI